MFVVVVWLGFGCWLYVGVFCLVYYCWVYCGIIVLFWDSVLGIW